MNESEQNAGAGKKSHWRSLAESLGAAPPAEEPDPDVVSSPTDQPTAKAGDDASGEQPLAPQPRQVPRERPKRPPTDWFAVAGELGVEVELPPDPPDVPSEPDLPRPPEADVQREPVEALPAPTEEFGGRYQEQQSTEIEAAVTAEPDLAAEDSSEDSSEDTMDIDFIEDSVAARTQDELDEQPIEQPPKQAAEPATGRRRRRGRRRSTSGNRNDAKEVNESAAETEADIEARDDLASAEQEPAAAESGDESDEPSETPRKRRPRRRRRRPRSSDEPENEQQQEAEAEDGESDAETAPESESAEDAGPEGGGRAKHRKIPTWEEAISVMVTNNIESRSKNDGSKGKSRGPRRRRG